MRQKRRPLHRELGVYVQIQQAFGGGTAVCSGALKIGGSKGWVAAILGFRRSFSATPVTPRAILASWSSQSH